MTEYDGKTSLQKALEQLRGVKLSNDKLSKITGAYRERLNVPTGKPINTAADKLKIYQWECGAIAAQTNSTELPPIEGVTQSSLETLEPELNLIQPNDNTQSITKSDNELNIIQNSKAAKDCKERFYKWNGKKPSISQLNAALGYPLGDCKGVTVQQARNVFINAIYNAPFRADSNSEQAALEVKRLQKSALILLSAYKSKTESELNITHDSSDTKQTSELNLTQLDNDAEPVTNELNITHNQNDSRDKFISINYRHADNSRHTVQIEQFYIDALIAIGITDISKFVAENAGVTTVTKNVKRAIVNELVARATNLR